MSDTELFAFFKERKIVPRATRRGGWAPCFPPRNSNNPTPKYYKTAFFRIDPSTLCRENIGDERAFTKYTKTGLTGRVFLMMLLPSPLLTNGFLRLCNRKRRS